MRRRFDILLAFIFFIPVLVFYIIGYGTGICLAGLRAGFYLGKLDEWLDS